MQLNEAKSEWIDEASDLDRAAPAPFPATQAENSVNGNLPACSQKREKTTPAPLEDLTKRPKPISKVCFFMLLIYSNFLQL